MVNVHGPVPLPSPLLRPKASVGTGVAVSVTDVPWLYDAVQPVPPALPAVMVQLIAGDSPAWLLTVPLPVPLPEMFKVYDATPPPEKLARTSLDWVMTTRHIVAVPVQAPIHPAN